MPTLAAHRSDDVQEPTSATVAPGAEATAFRAVIVLVGAIEKGDEFVALLRELLGRQGIDCEFARAARFDPDELFAEGGAEASVRVFVRLPDTNHARLYFRGPTGERFLLRTIALPSGLDEVGRELVGQVVESSVVALVHSSTGLSREEASAEVSREVRVGQTPPAPRRTVASEASRGPTPRRFAVSVWLRYAAESFGPDLGLSHGPGVEFGVSTRGASFFLRGRVSGEWFFEQTLDAEELGAGIRTTPVRLSFDVGLRVNEAHRFALGIGGGVDVIRVVPGAPNVEGVTPSEPQTDVAPVVRPELRYELASGSIEVGAAAFVDVSLVRTHYDLVENGEPTRLATPWSLRPGGALLLGFVW